MRSLPHGARPRTSSLSEAIKKNACPEPEAIPPTPGTQSALKRYRDLDDDVDQAVAAAADGFAPMTPEELVSLKSLKRAEALEVFARGLAAETEAREAAARAKEAHLAALLDASAKSLAAEIAAKEAAAAKLASAEEELKAINAYDSDLDYDAVWEHWEEPHLISGDASRVVGAMQRRAGFTQVQESGCNALAELARAPGGPAAVAAAGAVPVVVAAVRDWVSLYDDEDRKMPRTGLTKEAFEVLNALLDDPATSDDAFGQLLEEDGSYVVPNSLMSYLDLSNMYVWKREQVIPHVLVPGMNVLVRLCAVGYALPCSIEAAVAVMRRYAGNATVQRLGCSLIRTVGMPDSSSELTAEYVEETQCLQAVVAAMSGHAEHAAIQQEGCLALAAWAERLPEHRDGILAAGGAEAAEAALKYHAGSAHLEDAARLLLAALQRQLPRVAPPPAPPQEEGEDARGE